MSDGRHSHARLYALIALMTVIWSANYIVAKYTLREIPPVLTAGLRTVLSAFIMLPFYWWSMRQSVPTEGWSRRDLPTLISVGILGVGLNQVFFVMGMARTSVAHAAIIIGLTPVTVLLLAAAMGQEKLRAARLLGMFIALGGLGVLQFASSNNRANTLVGDLLIYAGSFTFAVFTVRGKAEAHRLGGITVNTFAYVASGLMMLPLTLWLARDFDFRAVTWMGWTSLLYMAGLSSVLCYLIYYHALRHISASRVSAFSYLQPLLATLIAIPMLGEYPTRTVVAGGALVFAGVFLAERA